jgi:NADP-dependent 3-hydroxy acid dehydrogenase YdfG
VGLEHVVQPCRPSPFFQRGDHEVKLETWLITGASSGFGLAFAEHAVEQEHNVVATARRVAQMDSLRALALDRVLTCELDVTQASAGRNCSRTGVRALRFS